MIFFYWVRPNLTAGAGACDSAAMAATKIASAIAGYLYCADRKFFVLWQLITNYDGQIVSMAGSSLFQLEVARVKLALAIYLLNQRYIPRKTLYVPSSTFAKMQKVFESMQDSSIFCFRTFASIDPLIA